MLEYHSNGLKRVYIVNEPTTVELRHMALQCQSDFYAPPTIVEGHYVSWSVARFVRPSVRMYVHPFVCASVQVKVFGQGSF